MPGPVPGIFFAATKRMAGTSPAMMSEIDHYGRSAPYPFVPFSTSTYLAIAAAVGEKSWR